MRLLCHFANHHQPHGERGASLLEFAIAGSVMLLCVIGFLEFAFAVYTYLFVASAAQQGARYAIVHGAHWGTTTCASTNSFECNATSTDIQNYVRSLANPAITASSLAVNTIWPGENIDGTSAGCTTAANSPGCEVTVKVSYPFGLGIPFMPHSTLTFTSSSEMAVQE